MADRVELRGVPDRLSWAAIFGGTVVALGVWVLLYALGLALGLSKIDPEEGASQLRAVGVGTGIWSLVAPLIALFLGGVVAARVAGIVDRVGGALHGAVLWGLTAVVGLALIVSLASAIMGGVLRFGGRAVAGVAGAAGAAAERGAIRVDSGAVLGAVNARLRAQGRPEVTAAQLRAATQDAVAAALRGERLDRQEIVSAISANTALDRADAEEIAIRFEAQVSRGLEAAQKAAQKAAEASGKALWGFFATLLLGLASAVLGSSIGVSRQQRQAARAMLGPRTEVHP